MSDMQRAKDSASYNYGDVITPFAEKGQRFDFVLGDKVDKARFWRACTLMLALVALLLTFWLLMMLLLPRHSLLTTQVNNNGFARSVGVLDQGFMLPNHPSKTHIQHFVRQVFNMDSSGTDKSGMPDFFGVREIGQQNRNNPLGFSLKNVNISSSKKDR